MRNISSITGPISYGETSWENRSSTETASGETSVKSLINKANAVPIMHIFKHYGLRFDTYSHKTTCPFVSHKGGRENTPSFKVYEDTNSFKCFGCGVGGRTVHFVSEMDRCNAAKASLKILQLFASEINEGILVEGINSSERLEIMLKFSSSVYDFRQVYTNEHAISFIEYICWVFDRSNEIHDYDNDSLHRLVEHCVGHINIYSPELTLTFQKEYLDLK